MRGLGEGSGEPLTEWPFVPAIVAKWRVACVESFVRKSTFCFP